MKFILFILCVVTLNSMTSCGSKNEDLIVGTWNEVQTGNSVSTFNSDKTYHIDFEDGTSEDGTWRIDNSTLYTIEKDDNEELSVELTTLDEEKLVQNIAGMFETVYSRKK